MNKLATFLITCIIFLAACSTSRNISKIDNVDTTAIVLKKPSPVEMNKVRPFSVESDHLNSIEVLHENTIKPELYSKIKTDLTNLYQFNNHRPIWLTSRGPKSTYKELLNQWQNCETHGLEKEVYNFSSLNDQIKNTSDLSKQELAALDAKISANYLLFNYHLVNGRFSPHHSEHLWYKDRKKTDLIKKLARVRSGSKLKKYFEGILPSSIEYNQMVNHLAFYKKIQTNGGWNYIDFSGVKVIEPGDSNVLIPQIRKRLLFTDPMSRSLSTPPIFYDDELVSSVKKFQKRHGLKVDGRIGHDTFEAMNMTVEEKIDKIVLNLERFRWLPRKYSKEYLLVNIPSYQLRAYEKSKVKLSMRVIVGKEYTSTPIFSDTLRYLVFSPTWTVPFSIKSKEMLPRLQRNPEYYSGRTYKFYRGWSRSDEVEPSSIDWSQYSVDNFPFNVVQQPGPANALGLVKFIMPNNLSIYLHDTPTDYLFERTERALSHGCIRVSEPAVLAKYLLRDQKGWDEEKIYDYMHKDEPQRIYFNKNYHVQLTYLTSFVDEYGFINFRKDIYGHDQAQLNVIDKLASVKKSN